MVLCLVQRVCGQKENIPNKILRTSVLWQLLKLKLSTWIGGVLCWRSPGRCVTHSHYWHPTNDALTCSEVSPVWGLAGFACIWLGGDPQAAQKSLSEHHSESAHVVTCGLSLSQPPCPGVCQGTRTEGRGGCGAAPQCLAWMADVHLPIAVPADARMWADLTWAAETRKQRTLVCMSLGNTWLILPSAG